MILAYRAPPVSLALRCKGQLVEGPKEPQDEDHPKGDAITWTKGHCVAAPACGVAAVVAAGVAPVDIVDVAALPEPVAASANVSDIWNWTGKGQPPAPGDDVFAAGAAFVVPELPSEAELSETSLTPATRRNWTMVSATVDSSRAQPARTTAEGGAVEPVAEPAVDDDADDVDGAVA